MTATQSHVTPAGGSAPATDTEPRGARPGTGRGIGPAPAAVEETASEHPCVEPLLSWFGRHARALPWRHADTTAWGVLVSEVMLQQTPVSRVIPVYQDWLARWPGPAALAAEPAGEAVRAWGRLGYPRRALRLHRAATACVERHGGQVPTTAAALRALPGVGEYTAAAVMAFAFNRRAVVLDTNIRRVLARMLAGTAFEPAGAPRAAERQAADALLPPDDARASRLAAALMELGATVCAARTPACAQCPVAPGCAWLAAGRPAWDGPPRRGQSYAGTDRQCRGRLLALVRASDDPVREEALRSTWGDDAQRARALASLLADGLLVRDSDGRLGLPS